MLQFLPMALDPLCHLERSREIGAKAIPECREREMSFLSYSNVFTQNTPHASKVLHLIGKKVVMNMSPQKADVQVLRNPSNVLCFIFFHPVSPPQYTKKMKLLEGFLSSCLVTSAKVRCLAQNQDIFLPTKLCKYTLAWLYTQ